MHGGIPHYLNWYASKWALGENIKRNFLNYDSILYSLVDFLLHPEL